VNKEVVELLAIKFGAGLERELSAVVEEEGLSVVVEQSPDAGQVEGECDVKVGQ